MYFRIFCIWFILCIFPLFHSSIYYWLSCSYSMSIFSPLAEISSTECELFSHLACRPVTTSPSASHWLSMTQVADVKTLYVAVCRHLLIGLILTAIAHFLMKQTPWGFFGSKLFLIYFKPQLRRHTPPTPRRDTHTHTRLHWLQNYIWLYGSRLDIFTR